jgi:hypothetical protein
MSATLAVPPPDCPASLGADCLLSVQLGPQAGAVVRILALLQRRRCRVTRVDFLAGDRHRPGHLLIGCEAPAAHAHRVEHWVRALVDVQAVEVLVR